MESSLLSKGVLAYGGVVAVSTLRFYLILIPATIAVWPLYMLTGIGIVFTVIGLSAKESDALHHGGSFMVAGFLLGIVGLWDAWLGLFENEHTAEVCQYSIAVPSDPQAQWACPQVEAAHYVMWILIVALVIPLIFFLVVPFLAARQDRRLAQADLSSILLKR